MNLILHIETAVETASLCLSRDEDVLAVKGNPQQKDSAAWLHPAIRQLLQEQGYALNQLSAVAVSAGPGSYTGLRVGMAAAKGLCYALGIPLITLGTLRIMAEAAGTRDGLLCPMIDARRMEVFTALYDDRLNEIRAPAPHILTETSFVEVLEAGTVYFFGNGSTKFTTICQHPNARFIALEANAQHMAVLSHRKFTNKDFSDLAYAEPFYGKDFYAPRVQSL